MLDTTNIRQPPVVAGIELATQEVGFTMSSDSQVGSLLRMLVASKPAGSFLELGTGIGMASAWMLDGMDDASQLTSVDNNEHTMAIARRFLAHDPRVTFLVMDGADFIRTCQRQRRSFDLIFADMKPGKFDLLDETLALLKRGGFYVIDDLHLQTSWPEGHSENVDALISRLDDRQDLVVTKLHWSSGLIVAAKTSW